MNIPKLLAPCGSMQSLIAAISARADEVYFGASNYNARINAKNFTDDEFNEALKLCRLYDVNSNITLNTLVLDKEMNDVCNFAYNALQNGASSFIIQDLGLANKLKKEIPQIEIHASTQCACHNSDGAEYLSKIGFSRIVLARELSKNDIEKITQNGHDKYETEIFVHGAMCVSHSGMCLMSSCIGKRSGNRGVCAQPCRMKYSIDNKTKSELLSLKDLSLSKNIKEICNIGIASLKIEGRMKSPEYVFGVTSVFRKLLDERRNATKNEYEYLSEIFSRNGFTQKYFDESYKKNNVSMYGIRSDFEKEKTVNVEKNISYALPKIEVKLNCEILNEKPIKIILNCKNKICIYISEIIPSKAQNRPIDEEFVEKCLLKTGSTNFEIKSLKINCDEKLFLTTSQLNSVRREAFAKLENQFIFVPKIIKTTQEKITKSTIKTQQKIEEIFLLKEFSKRENAAFPLAIFKKEEDFSNIKNFGVEFPRVIFDEERKDSIRLLKTAKEKGAKFAFVHNISQINLCKEIGIAIYGGIGLNIFNSETCRIFEGDGLEVLTISPELNPAQIKDIKTNVKKAIFAYGRLPLMVLESCVVRASGEKCTAKKGEICKILSDRIDMNFMIFAEERLCENPYPCRNIVLNSVATDILNSKEKMEKINPDIVLISEV